MIEPLVVYPQKGPRGEPPRFVLLDGHLRHDALQAMGDYGVIRLVTEAQGDFVQIRVEDDGCGIPEDQIERIFDPFFTTRRTGTAAGLGLAHCYQIVRNHGGEISVESRVGAGTTFRIRLPVR